MSLDESHPGASHGVPHLNIIDKEKAQWAGVGHPVASIQDIASAGSFRLGIIETTGSLPRGLKILNTKFATVENRVTVDWPSKRRRTSPRLSARDRGRTRDLGEAGVYKRAASIFMQLPPVARLDSNVRAERSRGCG